MHPLTGTTNRITYADISTDLHQWAATINITLTHTCTRTCPPGCPGQHRDDLFTNLADMSARIGTTMLTTRPEDTWDTFAADIDEHPPANTSYAIIGLLAAGIGAARISAWISEHDTDATAIAEDVARNNADHPLSASLYSIAFGADPAAATGALQNYIDNDNPRTTKRASRIPAAVIATDAAWCAHRTITHIAEQLQATPPRLDVCASEGLRTIAGQPFGPTHEH